MTGMLARKWGRRPVGRPLVIGHRGASAHETENTVGAFTRAQLDGADGVELDVLLCGTGEVVVFHDDDLRRLAGRPQRVADVPWRWLRQVDLSTGGRIPTLAEALEACGPEALVNVELKAGGILDARVPALVEAVASVIEKARAADRVIVSSFDPRAVALWQRRRPDVAAGFLFDAETPGAVLKALALPFLAPPPVAVHPDRALCTPPNLARWRARGFAVNAWTVDDPDELRDLAARGVDGLITNDPAAARAALASGRFNPGSTEPKG